MIDIPKNQTGEYYFSLLSKKQREWFKTSYIRYRQALNSNETFDSYMLQQHSDYKTFIRSAFTWNSFTAPPSVRSGIYWACESQRTKPKVIQEVTITI